MRGTIQILLFYFILRSLPWEEQPAPFPANVVLATMCYYYVCRGLTQFDQLLREPLYEHLNNGLVPLPPLRLLSFRAKPGTFLVFSSHFRFSFPVHISCIPPFTPFTFSSSLFTLYLFRYSLCLFLSLSRFIPLPYNKAVIRFLFFCLCQYNQKSEMNALKN